MEPLIQLPLKRARQLYDWLPPGPAVKVLVQVSPSLRAVLMEESGIARIAAIAEGLDEDDAVELLADLPNELVEPLLARLPRGEALRARLAFGEDSAGAVMSNRFVAVLAALIFVAAQFVDVQAPGRFALAAGLSLAAVTIMAATLGSTIPLVLHHVKVDPAVATGGVHHHQQRYLRRADLLPHGDRYLSRGCRRDMSAMRLSPPDVQRRTAPRLAINLHGISEHHASGP